MVTSVPNDAPKKPAVMYTTLLMCFCIAILEGFDIQSIGIYGFMI